MLLFMTPLECSKLFGELGQEDIHDLKLTVQEISFPAKSVVFNEGDPGDGVYVIKSGSVQVSTRVGHGDEMVFAKFSEGDFFGEMAIIENAPRSATATAIEDSILYFIPRDTVLDLLAKSPQFALTLVKVISNRLREFNRQYVHQIIQAERLAIIGKFARSIVHDFKNPLNVIGLAADFAAEPDTPIEERIKYRDRIRKQIERISNMVNEFLEFTRTTPTPMVLLQQNYDEFVLPIIDELKSEAELKNVQIILENQPPRVMVGVAPQRLSRVFYNLVHNATEAMPQGGKIYIRFNIENNKLITEIEDTGPGLSSKALEHLFEPFYSFGKAHGTGLGLSICKRIVEDHGGGIWGKNSQNRGAIFGFYLPIKTDSHNK